MRQRRNTLRYVGAAGVALIAAVAANGIAASNTFSGGAPKAGAGNASIGGYTISGVSYTLNGTNPGNIDSVALTTDASASTVKIKLVAAGSTWYSCTGGPTSWTCATTSPQATVSAADQLDVVAAA